MALFHNSLPHSLGGRTGRHDPFGQIAEDGRPGADDRAVGDRDAGGDEDVGGEPAPGADRDGLRDQRVLGVLVVVCRCTLVAVLADGG